MALSTNPYFRPLLWPSLFLIAALPVLVWLGSWQLQRLEWKLGLITLMEERITAPAVDMAGMTPVPDDEYRRYNVTGVFLSDVEFHWLTTSGQYGVGYEVFSPFRLSDGRMVIVNRGYVPTSLKDPATRSAPPGEVTFDAIARVAAVPGSMDAPNDADANIWLTRDIAAMIALAGGENYLSLYLEREGQVGEQDWPKPDAAQITLVNNHLDYALTWFGLAIVLIAIYLAFHRAQGRIGYAGNSGDRS